jgi:hypothetical protein
MQALDTKRFPWIAEGRGPTDSERSAAILTSTALITAQRVATTRRNEGKDAQERAVKDFLIAMGFAVVPARKIRTLDDAPMRGQFCAESMVGSRKADIPVRLFDGRPSEFHGRGPEIGGLPRAGKERMIAAARRVSDPGRAINYRLRPSLVRSAFDSRRTGPTESPQRMWAKCGSSLTT